MLTSRGILAKLYAGCIGIRLHAFIVLKHGEAMNYVAQIPEGTVIGFKALPSRSPELLGHSGAEQLWSGLYPQLSFQSAMNYLPNQWDRGHAHASIVKLRIRSPLTFIVCKDVRMTHVDVSSVEKAEIVATAANELLGLDVDCKRGSILKQLGEAGVCLCIMDADDFELVLPHAVEAQLEMEMLFTFRQSEKIPGMIGAVEGRNVCKNVLEDVAQLGDVLGREVGDVNCLHVRSLLGIGTDKVSCY